MYRVVEDTHEFCHARIRSITGPLEPTLRRLIVQCRFDTRLILAIGIHRSALCADGSPILNALYIEHVHLHWKHAPVFLAADEIRHLFRRHRGFDYFHALSAMKEGVNLVVAPEAFMHDTQRDRVVSALFEMLYTNRSLRGANNERRSTLLLIGSAGRRRLIVQNGLKDRYTTALPFPRELDIDSKTRLSIVAGEYIVCARYGESEARIVSAQCVARFLSNSMRPTWDRSMLGAGVIIEDISTELFSWPVVLITSRAGKPDQSRFLLAEVTRDGDWNTLRIIRQFTVPMNSKNRSIGPIVCVCLDRNVTIEVDRSSGSEALTIRSMDHLPEDVRSIVPVRCRT